jgi:hypothetical protein
MKKRDKYIVSVVIILAVVFHAVVFVGVVVPIVNTLRFVKGISDRAQRGQEHLFYETDYEQLLAACRELGQKAVEGNLKPRQYRVFWDDPDPNASTFPQVILDPEPSFVTIEQDGTVDLELMPGPEFSMVFAFPEGQKGWGSVKLIDGLWFHTSDYGDEYPRYTKRLNAMIEEGRQRKAARAATQPAPPSGEQTAP